MHKIDVEALASVLAAVANLRDPGFSWDGSDYSRPSRSQAADRGGLALYAPVLKTMLRHAPSGFPCQMRMTDLFVLLQQRRQLFDCDARYTKKEATGAADTFRATLKDVYLLAKGAKETGDATLDDLVSLVDISPSRLAPAPPTLPVPAFNSAPVTPDAVVSAASPGLAPFTQPPSVAPQAPMSVDDVHSMFIGVDYEMDADDANAQADEDSGNDDVMITGLVCNCAQCRMQSPIPGAGVGAQRKETLAGPHRRLRQKTSVPGVRRCLGAKRRGPRKTACLGAKRRGPRKTAQHDDEPIGDPFYLVHRKTGTSSRPREAYVMSAKRYVVGRTEKRSAKYYEMAKAVEDEAKLGKFKTIGDARAFLAKVLAK